MSLKRNTLWNLIGAGLPLLLGAATIPFLITKTGVEAFGVLTLIWALIGYFSLFDFGLGRALTQQIAAALSTGRGAELPSLVNTGIWFTAATGSVGGIFLAAFAHQLAFHWLKVGLPLQSGTYHALLIAAVGIPMTTVTVGLRGILEAYEEFKAVNIMRVILGAANFCFPALVVILIGNSLPCMVASLVAFRGIVLLMHIVLVRRKLALRGQLALFDLAKIRSLLSFGAWMTTSNIIGPLMVTADRFIISSVLGAGMVAYYTVPFEVVIRVLVLPAALTSALFPRMASLMMTDAIHAQRLYRKCLLVTAAALLPLCVALAIGAKWALTLWIGNDFAIHSWLIVCIMAFGILMNGIAHVPFATIQASGDARSTALLHIAELAIYLPLLFFGLKLFGLTGAAIAWSTRAGIDLLLLLLLKHYRKPTMRIASDARASQEHSLIKCSAGKTSKLNHY